MAQNAMGFLLKWLRDQRGLSLRELAQLARVDHAYVYRLETGAKESPSKEVLSKLLRVLKAENREEQMLYYLVEHTRTDTALVTHTLEDTTITYDIFASAAGAAFRGSARPDYPKLIRRVRRILEEEHEDG